MAAAREVAMESGELLLWFKSVAYTEVSLDLSELRLSCLGSGLS